MKPRRDGEEQIEIGASPVPMMLSSTNWPGRWVQRSLSVSSAKRSWNRWLSATIRWMRAIRARYGRYGLSVLVPGCGDIDVVCMNIGLPPDGADHRHDIDTGRAGDAAAAASDAAR